MPIIAAANSRAAVASIGGRGAEGNFGFVVAVVSFGWRTVFAAAAVVEPAVAGPVVAGVGPVAAAALGLTLAAVSDPAAPFAALIDPADPVAFDLAAFDPAAAVDVGEATAVDPASALVEPAAEADPAAATSADPTAAPAAIVAGSAAVVAAPADD